MLNHISDLVTPVITNIYDKHGRGKDLSIKSLPSLDDLIWGLKRQKLVVLGGRPGQGKSSFMAQICWDFAKQGRRTAIFSLEMTEQVLMERLLCNEAGIDNYLTNTGRLALEHEKYLQQISDFKTLAEVSPLVINTTARTFADIEKELDGIEVDCVAIDYVQLIRTTGDRRTALEDFVRKLREYALAKDTCIILGSQINRSTHEGNKVRPPAIWNLKETGALEESADLVMLVHWDYQYTKDENTLNQYEIDIAKNRDGRVGTARCVFLPHYFRFEEVGYGEGNEKVFAYGGGESTETRTSTAYND